MRLLLACVVSAVLPLLAACGDGGGNNQQPDLSAAQPDMAFHSICGMPGEQGNSKGVGKFCLKLADCANNGSANICSSLGNDPAMPQLDSFFCTFLCDPAGPAGQCGENAVCQCQSGGAGCGCAPAACAAGGGGDMK